MRLRVSLDNRTKLEAALKEVNGKAEAHTIRTIEDLLEIVKMAEKKLSARGVCISKMKGAKVRHHPAGPYANAYGFRCKSTKVALERGAKHWFLTDVQTVRLYPKTPRLLNIRITPAMQQLVIANALRGLSLVSSPTSQGPVRQPSVSEGANENLQVGITNATASGCGDQAA